MKPRLTMTLAALAVAVTVGAGAGCSEENTAPAVCEKVSGDICTIAGTGIAGDGKDLTAALKTNLYLPQDVTIGPNGRPYIVDWNNHRIRVLLEDGTLSIVAGAGELGVLSDDPTSNRLNHPTQLTFDRDGKMVIAAWHNSRIKTVDLTNGAITDVCGNGMRSFSGDGGPAAMAALNLPVAAVYDAQWNLIISDQANDRLRRVDAANGIITTIAGVGPCATAATAPCDLGDGGPATAATFWFPEGQSAQPGGRIEIDGDGNIYVADTSNSRVRKIDATGMITTIAGTGVSGYSGDGGPATAAQISHISDVAVGPGGAVYIADTGSSCVRVVGSDGIISTAAGVCAATGGFSGDGGPATQALLDRPTGLAFDGAGNLYIADTHNQRVRVVYR